MTTQPRRTGTLSLLMLSVAHVGAALASAMALAEALSSGGTDRRYPQMVDILPVAVLMLTSALLVRRQGVAGQGQGWGKGWGGAEMPPGSSLLAAALTFVLYTSAVATGSLLSAACLLIAAN